MTDEPTLPKSTPTNRAAPAAVTLRPELASYVASVLPEVQSVPDDRKEPLDKLAQYIRSRRAASEVAKLVFICTHNSRRSHISQLWAATAAAYYGVKDVETYSGGTEATAFNPRAVAAMKRAGFEIDTPEGENPRYQVSFSDDAPTQTCFSKEYDDDFNPKQGFAAILTCSEADKNCPMVFGAELRLSLPYVDPKAADGTPGEASAYDARVRQIATEMFYLFQGVAHSTSSHPETR